MAKLTRRWFLKQTSVGMAAIGGLAVAPRLAAVGALTAAPKLASIAGADLPEAEQSTAAIAGPLVAHVRDLATGEIGVLVGTREIIFRDPEIVMRLLKAAH